MNVIWLVTLKYIFICLRSKVEAFDCFLEPKQDIEAKTPAALCIPIIANTSLSVSFLKIIIFQQSFLLLKTIDIIWGRDGPE